MSVCRDGTCGNVLAGAYTLDQCRTCWNRLHTPAYRDRRTAVSRPAVPCPHRGEPTGQTVECSTCSGKVMLKVFACAKHGGCTIDPVRKADGIHLCDGGK